MRPFVLVSLLLGIAGCATSKPAGGPAAPTSFQPVCLPCTQPCTPETSCAGAKAPTFSPAAGTFQSAQQVTVSSETPGAEIRCTTDGSEPTSSTPVVSGPVSVDKSTTLKCRATKPGTMPSAVTSGAFNIQPPPPPPPAVAPAPPPPPPPAPETPRVVVTKQKLELKDKIYFDTGKATIKPESYSLLDEVAQALTNHDEVKKVSIDGHTDSVGGAKYNQKLSEERAKSVRDYLVKKGIDPSRLEAKGFGETKPVASNKTAQGREQNRRVEFNIVGA